MILNIVVILIVGLIAYMHYLQGLLSGLISLVLALIASAMAISYFEPLAEMLSGGKFNDSAYGICLIALFALVYLIGRIIFDKFVPGNVRLPHLIDSIGGAVLGLFVGIIGLGIVVIALQLMPLGPSIAGYARYPLTSGPDAERSVAIRIEGRTQAIDRVVIDQMKNDNLEKDSTSLILPVDDIVVGIAKRLSSTGSLSTGKPFDSIHPDLMQELYGQRIGIETGAKHTASNSKGTQVEVVQVNVLPKAPVPQMVGEFDTVWPNPPKGNVVVDGEHRLVSVTVKFSKDAGDEDFIVRFSLGAIRLVTPDGDSGWTNNFPIGTYQGGKAWINKIDDFMFVEVKNEDRGANFLFLVKNSAIEEHPAVKNGPGGKPTAESFALLPGTFIEVKRLAKLSLDDAKIEAGLPPEDKKFYPMRKTAFYKEDVKAPDTAVVTPPVTPRVAPPVTPVTPPVTPVTPPPTADNGWGEAPLDTPVLVAGNQLPVAIGVGSADSDVLAAGASGHLTAKQFDSLDVDPSNDAAALAELPKPGNPIQQLMVPAGKRMVQVQMSIKAGADSWAWLPKLAEITVVDATGTAYKPSGVLGLAGPAGATQKLLAVYRAAGEITLKKVENAPLTSVTFVYLLPTDQKATELRYQGKAGGLPLEK